MSGRLAWLLLLVLRPGLSGGAAQTPPGGLRDAPYEVTTPRRLLPRQGGQRRALDYLLRVGGRSLVVHLRPARGLVPRRFPVFSYGREGELRTDFPFVRDDCFYRGSVRGQPSSLAALSTCSGGLRGLLRVGGQAFEIEPVPASASFQHVVYPLQGEGEGAQARCGLSDRERSRQEALIRSAAAAVAGGRAPPEGPRQTGTRYAKVAVVVDHERYVQFGGNETLATIRVLDAVHLADSLFQPLGLRVALVGLEIWSQRNLVAVASGSLEELLDGFNAWRRAALAPRLRHDVGHLWAHQYFGAPLGLAFVGGVCDPLWASAVEVFVTSSLLSFSLTFAHQLGHSLGLQHDQGHCTCRQPPCIMAATRQSNASSFSDCSRRSYSRLAGSGRKQCLLVPPDHEPLYEPKDCGNRLVESGEQCDCGPHCASDACCQANCMLRPGASCAWGECCAHCRLLPAGTLCRERAGACDLPEFCTGASEGCPEDLHVQDGAPCQGGAYCYHGRCSTHRQQCQALFGRQAAVAPLRCFQEVNSRGDRFGNCGAAPGNAYKKCESSSILCGRVQCTNVREVPGLRPRGTVLQTSLSSSGSGGLCWGTGHRRGSGLADPGEVRDGTGCGSGKICLNGDCVQVSLLGYGCNSTKCHRRGVCNSRQNCHCDYGWAPPHCLAEGYGGSVDSGPPPPSRGTLGVTASVGLLAALPAAAAALRKGVGIL